MSVGVQPTVGSLNNQLAQNVIALRDAFQNIQNLQAYIAAAGGSTFLQGLQMPAADAAVYVSTLANHDQLRQIYQGLINLPAAFNYQANGNLVWGGN